ncbi:MAG: M56 family metallopeptidase [Prevotella sp.]|nr:M56 family metallopeptidase [Prevotella sp.]
MMTDLIYYDLKVAALIVVFYLFYRLLLARDTSHRLNRAVLLLVMTLSLVLPLCIITFHRKVWVEGTLQPATDGAAIGDVPSLPVVEAMEQNFDWTLPLAALLLTGTVVRLLFVVSSYKKLKTLISNGEKHTLPTGTQVSVVDAPVAPFSWMHNIVVSRDDWGFHPLARGWERNAILAHEEAHVRHHHSYDMVVVEVLTALQWFNPVLWFLRQELRIVHEFQADASVLSSGFDESQYIHLLMQKATGIQACALANGIRTPKTKKRILMMLKPKSNYTVWIKALYVVPVALVSLAMTARTVIDYETISTKDNPAVRVFHEKTNGRGDSYQIRYMPGVKFFRNGKEEVIPGNRPIALEVEKTTMQINGKPIERTTLLDLPGGQLQEIHLSELSPDRYVCNLVTEKTTEKKVLIVDGELTTEEAAGSINTEDIVFVDVINSSENIKKAFHVDADVAVLVQTKQVGDEPIFDVCEQQPQFPGGDVKMMEFLAQNIKYPEQAEEWGVQGKVFVQFIVEKDGRLSGHKAIKHSSSAKMVPLTPDMSEEERQTAEAHNAAVQLLSDEAVRVVKAMPKWTPGKQGGKAVRVRFTIPVTYRLQ